MRAVGEPDRGGGAADLLHGDAMVEVAHGGTTVLFRRGDAEHAEVAEFAPEVGGELVLAVDGGGAGGDFVGGEVGRPGHAGRRRSRPRSKSKPRKLFNIGRPPLSR